MYDIAHSGPKDAPNNTPITQDGLTITINREDPYGFLVLTSEDVKLPEKYLGKYTSIETASKAINLYFEERKKALTGLEVQKA